MATAGVYSVSAVLADAAGNQLASAAAAPTALSVGSTKLTLSFDADALRRSTNDGPYVLTSVVLWDDSSGLSLRADFTNNAYLTAPYWRTNFSDLTPPQSIGDLTATSVGSQSVTLRWTAPDSEGKAAAAYSFRYRKGGLWPGVWDSAIALADPPVPAAPGTMQVFTITNLSLDTTYCFGIKSMDQAGNESDLSNILTVHLPSAITSAGVLDNGQFHCTFAGEPGINYVVQASTDLVNWSNVTTITASMLDGTLWFTDPSAASFPQRFYRLARSSTPFTVAFAALGLSMTESPNPVPVGTNIAYTLSVANSGPGGATGAVLTDTLPSGVVFISATASQGECIFTNGTVTCNLGKLGVASSATATIVVTPTGPGPITNLATVFGAEKDPNTNDNFAANVTTVVPPVAALRLATVASPDPVMVGSNLTYVLSVTNDGPAPATGVVITNILPAGVTFVGATSSSGQCSFANGTVICSLGDLGVSSDATATIVVIPTTAGLITNLASVVAAQRDPDTSDNFTITISSVEPATFADYILSDGDFGYLLVGTAPSVNDPAGHWLFPAEYVTDGVAETNVTEFTIVSAPDAPDSGNCLQLSTASSPAGNQHLPNIFNRVLPALLGQTVIVSFDIYVYSGHGGGSVYVGYYGYVSDLNRGPQLSWTQTGDIIYTVGPVATNQVLVPGYPSGVWQSVRLEIGLAAASYDVYWGSRGGPLDKVGVGLQFRSGPLQALDRFTIARFEGPDTGDALSCYDNVSVTIQEPPTPTITTQPADFTKNAGEVAVFSVTAAGAPPLNYQWRKDGMDLSDGGNISGSQTAVLTLRNVLGGDGGGYSVVIANTNGSMTSQVATLTVLDPFILSQPISQAAILGQTVLLSVAATGTLPLSYQWRKDGTNLVAATDTSVTLTNVGFANAGNYDVVVSSVFGSVTSTVAALTVFGGATPDSFDPDADGAVYAVAVQADGKVLVGGSFTSLGGQTSRYIGRLNGNGTLDTSFNAEASGEVYSLAIQTDGKILVGGDFLTLDGQTRYYIGRLNADGTLDSTFDPGADFDVYSLAVQADGKILVGGGFNELGGQPRDYIGRLNAIGTLDTTFDPGADYEVCTLAVQADGRILVGGGFDELGGQSRDYIGRLNDTGTLDTTFDPGADNEVYTLAVQANDKILVGGDFNELGGQVRHFLGRLNSDGGLDGTFNPGANDDVYSVAVQSDGRIVLGGLFTQLGGQWCDYLGRLNANGTLDSAFNPAAGGCVYSLAVQADGKILVGGYFTALGGELRKYIGRLNNTGPATENLAFDGSTITWLRGGASPEVWCTTFEASSNGTDWSNLGPGTRIVGGWQLTDISLPANSMIRARGFVTGGDYNGSGWFVETTGQFGP